MKRVAIAVIAALSVVAFGQTPPPPNTSTPPQPTFEERIALVKEAVGKPVPAFVMTQLNDEKLNSKDLLGKVVVIDFWATWCGPCKAAAPKLNAIHDAYKGKDLVVIGANLAERDGRDRIYTKDNAVAYQKEHGYGYTFTYNNDQLGKDWKVPGYPTFFIIDKKGVVREVMVGFNEAAMKKLVAELTAE